MKAFSDGNSLIWLCMYMKQSTSSCLFICAFLEFVVVERYVCRFLWYSAHSRGVLITEYSIFKSLAFVAYWASNL